MFRYIELKNFLSFKNIEVDFRKGKNSTKNFIGIYGENGSGKSNFVTSIEFLGKSIRTFNSIKDLNEIKETLNKQAERKNISNEFKLLLSEIIGEDFFKSKRMVECDDEDTSAKYEFELNGHVGFYEISFKDKITYEKLYYFTGKQSGRVFEIKFENDIPEIKFSEKLFLNSDVKNDMVKQINKYWGNHTFLSILNRERADNNSSYNEKNYLKYVMDVINMIQNLSITCKKNAHLTAGICGHRRYKTLIKLASGTIKKENKKILDLCERVLQSFFTQTYSDVKHVYYKTEDNIDKIKYTLYFKKMIGGKIRDIEFSKESSGTQKLLDILTPLIAAISGDTVVFDEIDNGIHDLLLKNIISSMVDDISGQLIITTHNTMLLEAIDKNSMYIINIDYNGDKSIDCLGDFSNIQKTNNIRTMYLKGLFGGIPISDYIDYDEIIDDLEENSLETENGKI